MEVGPWKLHRLFPGYGSGSGLRRQFAPSLPPAIQHASLCSKVCSVLPSAQPLLSVLFSSILVQLLYFEF
ncbi:hypothetical protein Mapa_002771 [Marchantia paleacea]|nr:hypothetical protein Mapa_002771 [Marchantia paleacea]